MQQPDAAAPDAAARDAATPDASSHDASPTPEAVLAYLAANPGFLAATPALYERLAPPVRVHGAPLADHMQAMLAAARTRVHDVQHATAAAAADRRATESFLRRVQDAVLGLMRAPDPTWFATHDLAFLLQVDAARLCTETDGLVAGAATIPRGTVASVLGQRLVVLRTERPDALLHGEAVALAAQEALIRVPLATTPALLALACRDGAGLHGATTDALAFLGHAVGAAIQRP